MKIFETVNQFYPADATKILNPYTGSTTYAPVWTDAQQNGLGSAGFADESNIRTLEGGSALAHCPFAPQDWFCVFKVPSDQTASQYLWSNTLPRGNWAYLDSSGSGGNNNMQSNYNDETWADYSVATEQSGSLSSYAGEYVLVYMGFYNDGTCRYEINGEVYTDDEALLHDNNPEAPYAVSSSGIRLGAGITASGSSYTGPVFPLMGDIGELIYYGNSGSYNNEGSLSAAEVTGLSTWLMSKWNITTEIAS